MKCFRVGLKCTGKLNGSGSLRHDLFLRGRDGSNEEGSGSCLAVVRDSPRSHGRKAGNNL